MTVPCPCCKATNDAGPHCRRCKADLGLLFAVAADRDGLVAAARRLAGEARLPDALAALGRAGWLRAGPDVARLRAAVLVLAGRFADALRAYHDPATGPGERSGERSGERQP